MDPSLHIPFRFQRLHCSGHDRFVVMNLIIHLVLGLSSEQIMDFSKHAAITQTTVEANTSNTAQTWNIRCTEKLPVWIKLSAGDHSANNFWRMKHQFKDEYIPYLRFQNSTKTQQYKSGEVVGLASTTAQNNVLQFSIFAVANLNNNNQPRSTGIYKDSIAITISW